MEGGSLDLRLFANLNLPIARLVLILLWCWLQIHSSFPVKHYLRNLLIQLVNWILQSFLQFISHKTRLSGPSFKALSNEIVSKALEFLVSFLHLVILRVE